MANNFVNNGKDYSFVSTGASAYTADDIIQIGDNITGVVNNSVVANTDDTWSDLEDTQKKVVVKTEGVYTVAINTGEGASAGDKLYVDDATGDATTDADSGNHAYLGIAYSDQDGT